MDKKLWSAWLDFSTEAMKGAEQAHKMFESMSATSFGADEVSKWMGQWYPTGNATPNDMVEVVETWWKNMGAVPRSQYEEVLKQNEELWGRLKDSESKISQLRELMVEDVAKKSAEQAEAMLDEWEKTTKEVMEAQAEIAKKWSEGLFGVKKDDDK